MRDSAQAEPTLTILSDGEHPPSFTLLVETDRTQSAKRFAKEYNLDKPAAAIAADIANDMEAGVLNIGKEGVAKVVQTIAAHHIRAALPDLEAGRPGGTERAREHMEQALAASEMLERVTAASTLPEAKAVLQGGNVRAAG